MFVPKLIKTFYKMRNLTDITIILDRSGSMEFIKEATVLGFNSFLQEQLKSETDAVLTLVQFDHEYKVVYEGVDINKVKKLSNKTFIPRGTTALLDAIGVTISNVKNRIKLLKKDLKPKNVLIVIITDGEENSSNKFTREQIFKKISKKEKKDNWKFVFIGTNQDAISVGGSYGIAGSRALSYAADDDGTVDAFKSMSKRVYMLREESLDDFAFLEEDRKIQKRK